MKCLRGMLLLRTAAEAPTINAPIVEVVFKSSKTDPLRNDDAALILYPVNALALFKFLGTTYFLDDIYLLTAQWSNSANEK